MKDGGFRKLDNLGRVTIPIELREKFDIVEHDKIDFESKDEGILLKKIYNKCIFCKDEKNLTYYYEKPICKKCRKAISIMD